MLVQLRRLGDHVHCKARPFGEMSNQSRYLGIIVDHHQR
jgi:hypothetical protein